ncbi:MAG: ankyrin repeat domain-containing protein [Roseburia sp.]|nr:ankyrin repeat domain-containing protein [Roseburia sp.]
MDSDMTKYCYQHFENAYNIGWNTNPDRIVGSEERFNPTFIEKLTAYCENPLNRDLNGKCHTIEIDGKKYVKGFGEIRIIDKKNKIRYAAPNMIIDDILDGKYIPPTEFIEAVLTGPTFASEEYQEFYLNYSEKNFWGETKEDFEKIVKALDLLEDFEGFQDYILDNNMINIVTPRGSLLNYAIIEGKEKEALWLIENGIDMNAFDGLELMTAIRNNSNVIAKTLIEKGIVTHGREMKENPLVSAIRFSNDFLVEELMKNCRNLIVTYSNEYVRDCSILDIAKRTKNENIINIVKEYT